MFDVQAWWARDVMMDRIEVPNTIAMQADIDDRENAKQRVAMITMRFGIRAITLGN